MSGFVDKIKALFEQEEHGALAEAVDARFAAVEADVAELKGKLAADAESALPAVEAAGVQAGRDVAGAVVEAGQAFTTPATPAAPVAETPAAS